MKNVFIFPGQGAQKKGMIQDICKSIPEAQKVVNLAEEICNEPVSRYMWETDEAELSRSDRSQIAITTSSLAISAALCAKGIMPQVCAGFSLGEFAALCASNVLSPEDTLKLVCARGKIMQETCEQIAASSGGNAPGMAAVIGLAPETVLKLIYPLEQKNLAFAANLNSPKQTVISGTSEGLLQAEEIFTKAGTRRFIKLKVAGPFHSPLMKQAGEKFEKFLADITFKNPAVKLFSNVTGKEILSGDEAKRLAILHFTNPVHWTDEENQIAQIINFSDPTCSTSWRILEVGPGTVLTGLWRDSGYSENLLCKPVNTVDSIQF